MLHVIIMIRPRGSHPRTAFIACVGSCLLLLFGLAACQRSMIYHPAVYRSGTLDKAAGARNLEPWLNAAGDRIGWLRPGAASNAQVLILHGNAGSALDRVDLARGLQSAQAVPVYILEYPGYGDRAGSPSQKSLLRAATEALQLLTNRGPVYIVGESLGTGPAAYLAGAFPDAVSGLLLFCPYNNLTELAKHHTGSLVPVGLLLCDRFPSDQWLQNYRGPVGVLLAERDRVVPPKFGRRLYEGFNGPKKLWEVAGVGHNDVFLRPAEWWREVFEFWSRPAEPR